jgi:hypothetical protein
MLESFVRIRRKKTVGYKIFTRHALFTVLDLCPARLSDTYSFSRTPQNLAPQNSVLCDQISKLPASKQIRIRKNS